MKRIAIVGKPNTGKSTLFNRLCNKRISITEDMPGVTVDRKEYVTDLSRCNVKIVDTPGWEGTPSYNLIEQIDAAISEAYLLILVLNAQEALSSLDYDFIDKVRKSAKEYILVVNKSEGKQYLDENDIYALGLGDPLYLSALHGYGIVMLKERLLANLPLEKARYETSKTAISIVGRPNVGKSTMFNRIIGFARTVESPEAGTTRDSINYILEDDGVEIIDTAGLRKRGKIKGIVESKSAGESITAIRRCKVVILVVDAARGIEQQDLNIAHIAINEGKPLIIAANKCDLLASAPSQIRELKLDIEESFPQLKNLPILQTAVISKSFNYRPLIQKAIKLHEKALSKISTGVLNRWLRDAVNKHLPPLAGTGRRVRLKYITQVATTPPTFTIFGNTLNQLPDSYKRYLYNDFISTFELYGIPTRINYRRQANPYEKKRS